ncbi:hypothetical protein JB92DRAFT_913548 [Gautieria morchelliformis]|nr:hypothetical protein JB92DRAFT_913548 [Gautieria morchelliformis]
MANNRGIYDHRHFLHYPDKDPFSDAAQRRLDDLVKDILNTGISFFNGAGVRSINTEDSRGKVDLSNRDLDDATHQEYEALGDATVNLLGNEEDEDFESEFPKVDKGKGRDEREGPGLQGLWNSTGRFSPGPPPARASVDDATSLLSDSDSQDLEESNGEQEDTDGFFEEAYEMGGLDYVAEGDEENGPGNTEFEVGHSRSPSSGQEIIYVGDSDEEDEHRGTISDAEPDAEPDHSFEGNREWTPKATRDDDNQPNANWRSGSELDEETEGQELANTWHYSPELQGEGDSAHEPEWQQSQGKESDDDEGGFIADVEGDEGGHTQERHPHTGQPRRFFASSSLVDPWAAFSDTAAKTRTPVLTPAVWGEQDLQEHGIEHMQRRPDADGTGYLQTASLKSVQNLEPEFIDDTEETELGPPPELQSHDDTDASSHTLANAEPTGVSYLQPIPDPAVVSLERGLQSVEPSYLSSGNGLINDGQATDIPPVGSAAQSAASEGQDYFLSSLTSPESHLDIVQVPLSHDISQVVSQTSGSMDHHAHQSSEISESAVVSEPVGESTVEDAPDVNQSDSRVPVITQDFLEQSRSEESRSSPPPALSAESVSAELEPVHRPLLLLITLPFNRSSHTLEAAHSQTKTTTKTYPLASFFSIQLSLTTQTPHAHLRIPKGNPTFLCRPSHQAMRALVSCMMGWTP